MNSLVLKIAGLNLELRFNRKDWFAFCRGKYMKFWSSDNGKIDMSILVETGSLKNKKVAARIKYFSKSSAELLFNRDLENDFLIFNFLIKKVFAGTLLLNDGLMIHASSAAINGQAVLFAGESGKGKSTIVNKLNCRILANDRSILRFENGVSLVFCSPFYEQDDFPKVNISCPLSAIFLLEKKNTAKINFAKLDKGEAIFRLMPQAVVREDSPGLSINRQADLAFGLAEKLAKKIGVYTLSYPLNQFSFLKKMLNENQF
ncbi:hypothetical protein HZB78_00595 [Candidatus Collierbacteria bacterium]|nr:hypothetical protein [Candidatus Collierbacteria bacterium]